MYRLGVWNVWEIRYEEVFNSRIFLESWRPVMPWCENGYVIALMLYVVKYKVLHSCAGSAFWYIVTTNYIEY